MGSFRMRNIKCGLYLFAPDIGKAPVKRDMKNIFESEVKNSTSERSEKRLNGLAAMVSLLRSSTKTLFTEASSRMPRGRQMKRLASSTYSTSAGSSMTFVRSELKHCQCFNCNSQPFHRGLAFFEHLDLQWRLIGHEDVDSDEVGGLSVSNIKCGL